MKNKKLDATQIWKQFEDIVVPRLQLNIVDRAVYSHLLRHSRLEGKVRLQFSIPWLARAARLTTKPVRFSVRRLVEHGVLRLVERSKMGHLVDVRLPDEIRALRKPAPRPRAAASERTDFQRTQELRQAKVDRTVTEIRQRLEQATTEEQFQTVGTLCREALISLAQAVFDAARHPIMDGVQASPTDFKRMMEAYITTELAGDSMKYSRQHAKAAFDLANELQHKRTATFRHSALCAEATIAVINLVAIVSGQRDP